MAITAARRTRTEVDTGASTRRAGAGRWAVPPTGAAAWLVTTGAEDGRSQRTGTGLVRTMTPATGSGAGHGPPTDALPGEAAAGRPSASGAMGTGTTASSAIGRVRRSGAAIRRIAASIGTETTRRPDVGMTVTARSTAAPAPASTRARRESLKGAAPGDQATGTDGAMTSKVARVKARNNAEPPTSSGAMPLEGTTSCAWGQRGRPRSTSCAPGVGCPWR